MNVSRSFDDASSAPDVVSTPAGSEAALRRYYSLHARLYDATRWSFLFGRKRLVQELAGQVRPRHILEVGCGTGVNLARLARLFPEATLAGWDGSPDMLFRARRRLSSLGQRCRLRAGFYGPGCDPLPAPDLVVFSYCLSMIDPGWGEAIDTAVRQLIPGGLLAAVDFHGSRFGPFRRWMGLNHVRMERHLLPRLRTVATPVFETVRPAWGGLWNYFLFVGRRPSGAFDPLAGLRRDCPERADVESPGQAPRRPGLRRNMGI